MEIKGMAPSIQQNITPNQIWKKTFTRPRFSWNPDVLANKKQQQKNLQKTPKSNDFYFLKKVL